MKRNQLFLLQIFLLVTSTSYSQVHNKDTLNLYNEIQGDYMIYIKMFSIEEPFNIDLDNGNLWFKKKENKNDIELKPVDLDKLYFKLIYPDSKDFLTLYRDKNGSIASFKLQCDKKKYTGNKIEKPKIKNPTADEIFSVDILKGELTQVKDFLLKHPSPYMFTSKKEYNELFDNQMAKIDHPMDVREFSVIAAPLVEAISCGHTFWELPNYFWTKENKRSFPIDLIFIARKAYINSFFKEDVAIPVGSEIVSINDIKMDDIINSAFQIISSDGNIETWKFARLNYDFAEYFTILYGASDSYKVNYIEPGTKEPKTKTLPCIQSNQLHRHSKKTSTGKWGLDFETDKANNRAVITIKTFDYYNERVEEFKEFIDDCFKEIYEQNISNLILDLRGNDGGDPISAAHLFSYLEKKPVPYMKKVKMVEKYDHLSKPIPVAKNNAFEGNLYILIDGGCFSATGHLSSVLKYYKLGTFIGEETGGTYECNDAHYANYTKVTRLEINVAHITFATVARGFTRDRGIMPDYPVKPKIDDIIDGKDTVKYFAFDLIENDNKKNIDKE